MLYMFCHSLHIDALQLLRMRRNVIRIVYNAMKNVSATQSLSDRDGRKNILTCHPSEPVRLAGVATDMCAQTLAHAPEVLTRYAILAHQMFRHLGHSGPRRARVGGCLGVERLRVPVNGDHVDVTLSQTLSCQMVEVLCCIGCCVSPL